MNVEPVGVRAVDDRALVTTAAPPSSNRCAMATPSRVSRR
jgi:hypothetical protein